MQTGSKGPDSFLILLVIRILKGHTLTKIFEELFNLEAKYAQNLTIAHPSKTVIKEVRHISVV